MGYYTAYSIEVYEKDDILAKHACDLLEVNDELDIELGKVLLEITDDFSSYEKDIRFSELIMDDVKKWYDHDDDMIEISKRYPNYVFVLDGNGEDYDDLWRTYYWDGRMQYCPARIVYEEYNPNNWKKGDYMVEAE
jgi:hypothetical protein